jgi:hypothetical protein
MGSVEWITPSTLAIPVMQNSTHIKLKDLNGEPERGSEWELMKILSHRNSTYIPIATPSHTQTRGSTHKPPLIP